MTDPNCLDCGRDVGDDLHTPHQPGCTQADGCWCDTPTYCPAHCPTCNDAVMPPWHPYDGCYGCRAGNAIGKRAVTARQTPADTKASR